MNFSRKIQHEEFTKQIGKQSFLELLSICVSPLVLLLIRNILAILLELNLCNFFTNYMLDFICVIFPLVLLLTVASSHALSAINLCAALALGWIGYKLFLARKTNIMAMFHVTDIIHLPDLSTTVLVLSCLMILIIDFPICPRRFAKTSTFGLGLMDVGTGLFICISSGSGTHLLFNPKGNQSFWNRFRRSVLPCFLLGIFRLALVSFLGYQSPVEEYGIHWNFFFTVAVIRLVSMLVSNKWMYGISKGTRLVICFFVGLVCFSISNFVHSIIEPYLSTNQSWPSPEARASSIAVANIEGLLSLPGYLSIYFFTLGGYGIVLFRETTSANTPSIKSFMIVNTIVIVLTGCGIYRFGLNKVSRRFANPAYVMCILLITSVSAVLSWLFRVLVSCIATHLKTPVRRPFPSALFHTVSSYGMCYFLICNVCTGIVNICCDTLRFLSPNALADPRTGAYPINLSTAWPQLVILLTYAALTLGFTTLYHLRHGITHQFD